jgi:hypothetical protein
VCDVYCTFADRGLGSNFQNNNNNANSNAHELGTAAAPVCDTRKPLRYNAPHIRSILECGNGGGGGGGGATNCTAVANASASDRAGVGGGSVGGSTAGGTLIRLMGTGFGLPNSTESALFTTAAAMREQRKRPSHRVTIGGRDCANVTTAVVDADATDGGFAYQQCVIPPGQGKDVPVLVWVANQANHAQGNKLQRDYEQRNEFEKALNRMSDLARAKKEKSSLIPFYFLCLMFLFVLPPFCHSFLPLIFLGC